MPSAVTVDVLRGELYAFGERLEKYISLTLGDSARLVNIDSDRIAKQVGGQHSTQAAGPSEAGFTSQQSAHFRGHDSVIMIDERFARNDSKVLLLDHVSNPGVDSQWSRLQSPGSELSSNEKAQATHKEKRHESKPLGHFLRRSFYSKTGDPVPTLGGFLDDDDENTTEIALSKLKGTNSRKTGYTWNVRSRGSSHGEERTTYTNMGTLTPPDSDEEREHDKCWRKFTDFVHSDTFDLIAGCLIMLNAIILGLQVDYMARNWASPDEAPLYFKIIDHIFCIIFTTELITRICVYQKSFWSYLVSNLLDVTIVGSQILDETLGLVVLFSKADGHIASHREVSVLRMLRILRLVRILRLARILHLFGELRVLIVSIFDSIRSLIWTIILILLLTYTFAVYLTQLLTDYKLAHQEELQSSTESAILQFYGNLGRTMLSLYESILAGRHWHDMLEPLMMHCSPYVALVFIIYITCCLLALMNVVTSVFVTTALKHAEEDSQNVALMKMRAFFNEVDESKTGKISWQTFEKVLPHPIMLQFFKDVDMHTDQAAELFNLIDAEGKGEIDIDDLVSDCLRFRGPAKSIDLAIFVSEYERDMQRVQDQAEQQVERLNVLQAFPRAVS